MIFHAGQKTSQLLTAFLKVLLLLTNTLFFSAHTLTKIKSLSIYHTLNKYTLSPPPPLFVSSTLASVMKLCSTKALHLCLMTYLTLYMNSRSILFRPRKIQNKGLKGWWYLRIGSSALRHNDRIPKMCS